MAKRVPAPMPTRRVVQYLDPTPRRDYIMLLTPAQLQQRRRQDQLQYARWVARQQAIAERDRKARRFWLGFGAVFATGLLTGLGVLAWLLWHAATAAGLGLIAIPVVVIVLGGALMGGHRCITVIQHRH